MDDADLVASIQELGGATEPLEPRDPHPAEATCPRCQSPMTTCVLRVGRLELPGRFLRCERDGTWLARDALVSTFARASRLGHAGGGSLGSAAGQAYFSIAPRGTVGATVRWIGQAFGRRAAGQLAISRGPVAPRVLAVFQSALAGLELACPVCSGTSLEPRGDRWACNSCGGVFVENAALGALISDMTLSPGRCPRRPGNPGLGPVQPAPPR